MRQLCLLAILLPACASTGRAADREWGVVDRRVESISLVALLAQPNAYEGKLVRVIGAFRLEFEGNAICLHSEDIAKGVSNNCLWISLDLKRLEASPSELEALNGSHVLLEGTFTA